MNIRFHIVIILETLLLVTGLIGQTSFAAPTTETVAQVHWLGLNQISTDTNSAQFMKVWQLPQTAVLVAQTLDKISRWPGGGVTNASSTLLRPLLDDLITSEFLLEVQAPTNLLTIKSNLQIFLELPLPAARSGLWQTNLAAALEGLTGVRPVPAADGSGWSFRQQHAPCMIEFSRAGEWTRIGIRQGPGDLSPEFSAQIADKRALLVRSATNFWLEASLDLPRLTECFSLSALVAGPARTEGRGEVGFSNPSSASRLDFTVSGDGGNLLTRGTVSFSRPVNLVLPPWKIPTNLIHQPLNSFLAVRGLAPWLAAMPAWQKLKLAPPPNQAYFWAQPGIPFQTYFAAPLPAASNQLYQLAGRLMQNANPWLATNGEGNFQWQPRLPGIVWNDANIISPFLRPATANGQDYFLGGLYPLNPGSSSQPLAELMPAVFGTTNLVYYHTEQTGFRVEDYLFITQLLRLVFHKPQLPPEATTTRWLKSVVTLLAGSTTIVTQPGAERLAMTRISTIGFTALELHLLADWLESPEFPLGLYSK